MPFFFHSILSLLKNVVVLLTVHHCHRLSVYLKNAVGLLKETHRNCLPVVYALTFLLPWDRNQTASVVVYSALVCMQVV